MGPTGAYGWLDRKSYGEVNMRGTAVDGVSVVCWGCGTVVLVMFGV